MEYAAWKLLHQGAVVVSVAGFALRGSAALAGAAWVRSLPARTVPHVVDTVLLGSALMLAWIASLNPLHLPWLAAKIIGLVVYIGLGLVALRPGLPRPARVAAFAAALLCAAQIVATAITKSALGLLALL